MWNNILARLCQLFMTLTLFSRSPYCEIHNNTRQNVSTGHISLPVPFQFNIYLVIGSNKIILPFDDLDFIFKVTVLRNIPENKTNWLYRSRFFTDSL